VQGKVIRNETVEKVGGIPDQLKNGVRDQNRRPQRGLSFGIIKQKRHPGKSFPSKRDPPPPLTGFRGSRNCPQLQRLKTGNAGEVKRPVTNATPEGQQKKFQVDNPEAENTAGRKGLLFDPT